MERTTVFLIGFMGSGKTTLGKKLAHKMGLAYCDLDEELCRKYQVDSVRTYIELHGFDAFRKAESDTLKGLSLSGLLVSTGGGTPCYFDNTAWMKSRGIVVFLDVNEGVLYSRLKNEQQHERPLLKELDEEGLKNFIHAKLQERMPFYGQAHIAFNPVDEKLETLIGLIEQTKVRLH
jgi:shikimate kinase